MKKIIGVSMLSIGLLLAAGCSETEVSNESVKTEAKQEKTYKIGDAVNVGDMGYTVKTKETAAQVGPSVLPETASGKYLVIDVNVKNSGDEAVTVDSSFFKLKQGDKTYEADSAASMSANQGEDGEIKDSFFMQQLNPNSEMNGKVVFDLSPDVAEASDLTLQVQTGMFGTETENISLK